MISLTNSIIEYYRQYSFFVFLIVLRTDAEVPDGWTGAGPNITLYLSVAIVIILLLFAAYCIKMRLGEDNHNFRV